MLAYNAPSVLKAIVLSEGCGRAMDMSNMTTKFKLKTQRGTTLSLNHYPRDIEQDTKFRMSLVRRIALDVWQIFQQLKKKPSCQKSVALLSVEDHPTDWKTIDL